MNPISEDVLHQQARRRAGMKLGWYIHAAVYAAVNLGLMALALALALGQGRHWAVYPALGWGLGLLIHGAVVWLLAPGSPLFQQLLEHELKTLKRSEKR
ncbi:2TM domain-containing protein [Comamonas sp. Z3]|uniref:2TM domain-containing protein n=1 Tax=Comamonas sp. Z3 TaxID=2601247 RepID=UPI0011E89BBC|nr:2TM domain-containing protein [Comamonas sp. Z3]TYK67738.1 2TM domain-containing protein [Comamonas sp. Z3]